LAQSITKKLDVKKCTLTQLILMLKLHYFVKCRSSLAVYNNAFVYMGSACVCSKNHWNQRVIENMLHI